ncbi:uncharacterized protein LOC100215935 isoform X1 [Hydra vulgaris]|uniref:uncharacterized protein LOC100215935 isoform X1 n=1 Tax=Hydra vulgaris TaxID=6087 RepID=UPI001F5EA95F|nr:uncharacterized protein LOC100215935 [Hydra vulgaris]
MAIQRLIWITGVAILVAYAAPQVDTDIELSDELSTNPLNTATSNCQIKSCFTQMKNFVFRLSDDLLMDTYHLSLVHRLKCLVIEQLSEVPTTNMSICSYDTSESFVKRPEFKTLSILQAVWRYQHLFEMILKELFDVLKSEDKTQEPIYNNLLQVINRLKLLISRIQNIIQPISECMCQVAENVSEVYIQSYNSLRKKYSHTKSMFIILKQLNILRKIIKEDIWKRQKKYSCLLQ